MLATNETELWAGAQQLFESTVTLHSRLEWGLKRNIVPGCNYSRNLDKQKEFRKAECDHPHWNLIKPPELPPSYKRCHRIASKSEQLLFLCLAMYKHARWYNLYPEDLTVKRPQLECQEGKRRKDKRGEVGWEEGRAWMVKRGVWPWGDYLQFLWCKCVCIFSGSELPWKQACKRWVKIGSREVVREQTCIYEV